MQNLKDIALELLAKYKKAQDCVIWEYSDRIEEEEKELDEETEKYRILINTVKSPVMHGEWEKISPAGIYEHKECGYNVMTSDIEEYNYCPRCGARMDGEEGD